MKNNLLTRFLVIIGVAIIACWITYSSWPPNLGIDLAGGTSLVYELDLSKLPKGMGEGNMQLAERVVEVLKKRVDPLGQKNIIWRVLEQGKRIQIQMPYAPKVVREAKTHEDVMFAKLQAAAWKQSEVVGAAGKKGEERAKALDKFASVGTPQREKLEAFVKAADRRAAADAAMNKYQVPTDAPAEVLAEQFAANKEYNQTLTEAMQQSVDPAAVRRLVLNADDPEKAEARTERDGLTTKYPLQKEAIAAYIAAHEELMLRNGGGVSDAAELKRLVTKAGVLDFRIAVQPNSAEISDADYQEAVRTLQQKGPEQQVDVREGKARWFQIGTTSDLNSPSRMGGYVTAKSSGANYILCYDDHDRTLTHTDPKRKSWAVTAKNPYNDPSQGGLMLPFHLDPIGGNYMGDLTSQNKGHPMAILLDDMAMSAPNIHTQINDDGVITFGNPAGALKEAEQLKAIMDAGSLPATLRPDPISEENISSDMGADNIDAGIRSAYFAVLAVMLFMLVYYTITGFFANVALMLNLVLLLASMAVIRGTFTLPGIAGLVLTLGMAVDANVLINERIREEIHRGASLWMAIKQGYDKVFWTIFDANLTTSLTSIVLIYVGSEEVKGFGVTLFIGLCIHMFTALFVTRTFMMAAVKWGVLRFIDDHSVAEYIKEIFTFTWLRNGHFPFMKVITVTNIDWIGKRHIFWGISAVITVAGLVAFVARREDKYDIEFRGGTQVTFQLKDPGAAVMRSMLTLEKDENVVKSHPELKGLGDALKDKSMQERNEIIAPKVDLLMKDVALVQAHPEIKDYGAKLKEAKDTTMSLDHVREKIEKLSHEQPGLAELGNARVYTIGKAGDNRFQMQTTIANVAATDKTPAVKIGTVLLEPLANTFKDVLEIKPKITVKNGGVDDVKELLDKGYLVPIKETQGTLNEVFANTAFSDMPVKDVNEFKHGAAIVLDDISAAVPITADELAARIRTIRQGGDFANVPNRPFEVIPVLVVDGDKAVPATDNDVRPLKRAVVVTVDQAHPYDETNQNLEAQWRTQVASTEWQIVQKSLATEDLFEGVTSFDAVVATQAKIQALIAIIISLALIVIYVWVRFGGILYGLGAILSLGHDAIMAVAGTVLSGMLYSYVFNRHSFLLITDFKINLTMIAAYLTVIGYSVNDTIVIFDRVRELRGKSRAPLSAKLINDAINQCFGRTIWTTFTVFIVVLIMYIWGGEGVRGFSFAMLIGVITGAYSTLAIASPMLLATGAGKAEPAGPNPFERKVRRVPELGEGDGEEGEVEGDGRE